MKNRNSVRKQEQVTTVRVSFSTHELLQELAYLIESRIGMRPSFDVLISRLCLVAKRLIDTGVVDPEDVLNPDKVLKLLGEKQQVQTSRTNVNVDAMKVERVSEKKSETGNTTQIVNEQHQETTPVVVIENVTESESENESRSDESLKLPRYILNNPWVDIIRLRSRTVASNTS